LVSPRDRPDDEQDREQLLARVAALTGALADCERAAHRASSELIVQLERSEGQRQAAEIHLDWYADLFDHAPIAYLALDGAGLIHDINNAAVALLGSDRQRLLGWPFRLHIAPEGRRAFLDHMHRSRRDSGQIRSELPLRVGPDRHIPIELISRRSAVAHDAGLSFRAALFDLRERKQAERELERAAEVERRRIVEAEQRTAQLRSLSAALFRVEADERRELATLLHDDLGQRLVAVRLRLAALAPGPPGATLAPVLAILDDAHAAVRSLSFQLSPPILHELGLVAALRWLAGEMQARYGLHVEFSAAEEPPALSAEARYLLFRSSRELLLNVVKHADTDRARLTTRVLDEGLELCVTDAGRGFDPALRGAAHSTRFGLLSISERVHARGGRLTIASGPEHGTQVRLLLPWEPTSPAASGPGASGPGDG